jgi:hypothetical protein
MCANALCSAKGKKKQRSCSCQYEAQAQQHVREHFGWAWCKLNRDKSLRSDQKRVNGDDDDRKSSRRHLIYCHGVLRRDGMWTKATSTSLRYRPTFLSAKRRHQFPCIPLKCAYQLCAAILQCIGDVRCSRTIFCRTGQDNVERVRFLEFYRTVEQDNPTFGH